MTSRLFVPIPEHCGVLAAYVTSRMAWCCASCGVMLLTDELAYRAVRT